MRIKLAYLSHRFGVTAEMVETFLEDLTLQEALIKKRIFIVDLAILEGISTKEGTVVSYEFLGLFFAKLFSVFYYSVFD